MDSEPPFQETYKTLFQNFPLNPQDNKNLVMVEECKLPLIDLSCLNLGHLERAKCAKEIAQAARDWGFFQIVNHGIPKEVLESMQCEQMKVFQQPFYKKAEENLLNLSANAYRWGNPKATCLRQFSWSEAFHIPLIHISRLDEYNSLRSIMEMFATTVASLAQILAEILAQELGVKSTFFQENCKPNTCYLRMNRYPPCPFSSVVCGLMPHTDSDFLTILYQDQIGGLQLMKGGRWFSVQPNPEALIINIGDLFQAWSNGIYKSIEHRVVASQEVERFSVAYFYCPSNDVVIQSCMKPAVYRKFSLREYRQQTQKDVQVTGGKVGLSRFLNSMKDI